MATLTFGVNPTLLELAGLSEASEGVKDAMREALARAAVKWFRVTLPKHFTHQSRRLYPDAYTPRRKRFGAYQVRSGAHKRTILGGQPTIRPFVREVRVDIKLPHSRVTNFWTGKKVTRAGHAHNFPRELTAFNARDYKHFYADVERILVGELLPRLLKQGERRMRMRKYTG